MLFSVYIFSSGALIYGALGVSQDDVISYQIINTIIKNKLIFK